MVVTLQMFHAKNEERHDLSSCDTVTTPIQVAPSTPRARYCIEYRDGTCLYVELGTYGCAIALKRCNDPMSGNTQYWYEVICLVVYLEA